MLLITVMLYILHNLIYLISLLIVWYARYCSFVYILFDLAYDHDLPGDRYYIFDMKQFNFTKLMSHPMHKLTNPKLNYPAKIEVMQTEEPTAIPASSPTCHRSN